MPNSTEKNTICRMSPLANAPTIDGGTMPVSAVIQLMASACSEYCATLA